LEKSNFGRQKKQPNSLHSGKQSRGFSFRFRVPQLRSIKQLEGLNLQSSLKGDVLANAPLAHDGGRAPARFSTERIEHKSAADGRIYASPVPPGSKKCANVRTIFEFSAENAKIADWLAERVGFELTGDFVADQ